MPPEQWRGKADIDFRADVYAVGCILYELLTGKWVYDARTVSELRSQHLEAPLPALNSDLPAGLKPILDGCLAKRREDRFPQITLLLTDITQLYEAHSDEPLSQASPDEFTAMDYSNRGVTFSNVGQPEHAIADFDHAIELDPNLAGFYSNRGISYSDLGQHERAIADYNRAIELDPNYAPAYLNRGVIYSDLGQHERAIADFDLAIELDPNYAPAYSNRGTSYGEVNQQERAIANFNRAIELDPNYASAYLNRGSSYVALGQPERAIADFDHAIALDPNDAQVYYNRSLSYVALGQPERAIADFDRAIELAPNDAEAYFNKGVALAKMGSLQESVPLFEKAYALGLKQAAEAILRVQQALAFEAFQRVGSLDAMRQVVGQFPILKRMIPAIEQVIEQQVPSKQRPPFEQRLAWLRQILRET